MGVNLFSRIFLTPWIAVATERCLPLAHQLPDAHIDEEYMRNAAAGVTQTGDGCVPPSSKRELEFECDQTTMHLDLSGSFPLLVEYGARRDFPSVRKCQYYNKPPDGLGL